MENKTLRDFLRETLEFKGYSLDRISQLSEIPHRYLEFILDGNYSKLPAAPYVRGYLVRLAGVLELNGEEIWQAYKKEIAPKSSGKNDKLPENRFAIKTVKKGWLVAGLAAILILVYGGVNAGQLIGKPGITVFSPAENSSFTAAATALLTGKINPRDKLTINGEGVPVGKSGEFSKNYSLEAGLNTFEIIVKRLLGRETKVIKQIFYQPAEKTIKTIQ